MNDRPLTELDYVRAVAQSPWVYEFAAALPEPTSHVGRPPTFHIVALVQLLVLRGFTGSMRRAAAISFQPEYWTILRDGIRRHCGDAVADAMPTDRGPGRHHYFQQRDRFDAATDAALDRFRDLALDQALTQGLLDPEQQCSVAHPARSATVVGDGTVAKSPVRPRRRAAKANSAEAARAPRRRDTAARWHRESGDGDSGQHAYGTKFVHLSVRGSKQRHDRVVLDLIHDPGGSGYGGEMALALGMIERLHARAPGLHGVRYDGAMRGKHRDRVMKLGLQAIAPPHDGIKPRLVERATHCGCPVGHDLWAKDGAIHTRELTVEADQEWQRLPIIKLERRGRRTFRWSHLIALPCGVPHRIRIDTTAADRIADFNRAEHLHQHPAGDEVYETTYGWREDAENLNSELDMSLFRGRLIGYGLTAQIWVLLGFVLSRNAASAYFHRQRGAQPLAA